MCSTNTHKFNNHLGNRSQVYLGSTQLAAVSVGEEEKVLAEV